MNRPLKQLLLILISITLLSAASSAKADSRPAVAILNPDQLQSGQRLIERLSDDNSLRVIERRNAGAIMPTPIADAPADVIAVLHASNADSPIVDIVVCDPQTGLRLAAGRIPTTASTVDAVSEMSAVIRQGMRKRQESVRTVIGVIPIRDNSINGRGSSLAASASHAVEKMLLSRPGTFLIETDRAYAIANELLRGWQRRVAVSYPTPGFLIGSCRIDGPDSAPRCRFDLELQQRGKVIAKRFTEAGSTEQCVAAGVALSADVLSEITASRTAASEHDIDVLIKQATELSGSGQWRPAWTCAEAALLIAPGRKDLRRVAAQSLVGLFKETRQLPAQTEANGPVVRRRWNFLRRAMRQFELYQRGNADFDATKEHRFATSVPSAVFSNAGRPTDEASKQFMETVKDESRQALLRIVRDRARVGNRDERNLFGFAVFLLPDEQKWPMVEQIILETQNEAHAEWRTKTLAKQWFAPNVLKAPLAQRMLENLERAGNADVRAAVAALRREHEAWRDHKPPAPRQPVESTKQAVENPEITFEPISLDVRDSDGNLNQYDARRLTDIVAAGDGVDLVFDRYEAFSLREKGILTRVWKGEDQLTWFDRVNGSWPVGRPCFDGRYVWACARYFRDRDPVLLIIDPVNGTWRSITARDGLPLPPRSTGAIAMTPVSPGKLCVAAGGKNAWLAMVSFDEEAKQVRYRVFHEASDVVNEQDDDQWRSTTLAFDPMNMFMLTAQGNVDRQRRIFVGRYGDVRSWRNPLVIDPDRLEVSVFTDCQIRPGANSTYGLDGPAMYWCMPRWTDGTRVSTPDMYRVGFPEFTQEKVASNFYSGPAQSHSILFHDGKVHVVSTDWCVATSTRGPYRKLRGVVPKAHGVSPQTIFPSNHYGLVLKAERGSGTYAVRFQFDD